MTPSVSYRAAIQAEERLEGSIQGHAHQSLAEVLVQMDDDAAWREAEHLLGQVQERLRTDHFRYQVARARLAHKKGDPKVARSAAVEALRLAAIKDPPLPRHPDIGLVKSSASTLSELHRLAVDGGA